MIIHVCDMCKDMIDSKISKTGHLNIQFENTANPTSMNICQGCYGKIMGLVKKGRMPKFGKIKQDED